MKKFILSVFFLVFFLSSTVLAQVIPLDQKSWYSQSEEGAPPPTWNGDEQVRNMGAQNAAGNMCIPQSDANCNLNTVPAAGAIWEVRIRDGNGATLADVALMDGADIAVTELALEVISAGYFWDIIDANFTPILGDELANETYAVTNKAPFVQNFNYSYDATNQEWRRHNILATNADGQALGENAMVVASYLYGYNGADMDLVRLGAVGEVQQTDVAVRPGEDAGNDNRKINKNEIAVLAPSPQTTATIGTAAVTVYNSTNVLNWPNFCIYLENTDGVDPMTDVDIETSPDEALWIDLGWAACDALAAGDGCVFCVGDNAYHYIRVRAAAVDANQTSSDVWITGNKN